MGKHSEVFVAFDLARKKHAVAIAEGGRRGKSDFLAMSKTVRCRSNARSGDWRIGTTGCRSALKPGRWIRVLSPGRGARPRLYGGRFGLDPETFGRAHQDEPARGGHAGATGTARRVDT